MRWLLIIFSLSGICFAVQGDLTGDDCVDYNDLYILCNNWLESDANIADPNADINSDDIVDFIDFSYLALNWNNCGTVVPTNDPPETEDLAISAYTYIVKSITLTATDDGLPDSNISFIITSMPSGGHLRDGNNKIILNSDLPYTLVRNGDKICYETISAGVFDVNYKAYDGDLYSDTNTITITVAANPKDCLSLDSSGYITIPDNSLLDLSASRGIGLCFNTRKPYCQLLRKHETGKAGYDMGLVGGKITVNIYSSSSLVGTIQSDLRYDNGQWVNAVFAYNGTNNIIELYIGYGTVINGWYDSLFFYYNDDNSGVSIPSGDYTNDCNMVIGDGYKWEIDGIRSYRLTMTDPFRTLAAVQKRENTGNTESFVPAPAVRFNCNFGGNNTATQIYDDISATHLVGTFSSGLHIRYYPFFMCPCNMME